jgi:hypothetical protein
MSIESEVALLTTATTSLTTAVGVQQTTLTAGIATFAATTARVNALSLVDNTTDIGKPVSTATVAAIGLKQNTLVSGVNISTVNGVSLLGGEPLVIARSATSLSFVTYDTRSSLRSTVSQVDDSVVVEALGLFMWVGTKLEPDDDETCFTTSTGQWLLRAPAWDLIDAWNLIEQSVANDFVEDTNEKLLTFVTK